MAETKSMNVTVLGAGSWGTTLSIVLHENGHNVAMWEFDGEQAQALERDRENKKFLPGVAIPPDIRIETSLSEALSSVDLVERLGVADRGCLDGISAGDAHGIQRGVEVVLPGTDIFPYLSANPPSSIGSIPTKATDSPIGPPQPENPAASVGIITPPFS